MIIKPYINIKQFKHIYIVISYIIHYLENKQTRFFKFKTKMEHNIGI